MIFHIRKHYSGEKEAVMEVMIRSHLSYWDFGLTVFLYQARLEFLAYV